MEDTNTGDYEKRQEALIKSMLQSDIFKSEKYGFYILNGGYEKTFCSDLAYLIENNNALPNLLACLEGRGRCDIVIEDRNARKINHWIQVKHSYSTHYKDAFEHKNQNGRVVPPRLLDDMQKLINKAESGTLIYLVSRIVNNIYPRGRGYKSKLDEKDENINEIAKKVGLLNFTRVASHNQHYSIGNMTSETILDVFLWGHTPSQTPSLDELWKNFYTEYSIHRKNLPDNLK